MPAREDGSTYSDTGLPDKPIDTQFVVDYGDGYRTINCVQCGKLCNVKPLLAELGLCVMCWAEQDDLP